MVLTFEQIKDLIELVAEHRLGGLEIEDSGFRVAIDGYPSATAELAGGLPPATPAAVSPAASPPAPAAAATDESSAAKPAPVQRGHTLTSPIVGTFYRSPSPDAEPFAKTGDEVKVGQVLCIVEAMKLMNEIESDVDGVIVEILPKNAQPVEFGEPLFIIESR